MGSLCSGNGRRLSSGTRRLTLNLLFTLTAYPPSLGGAQFLMHQLACHLRARHAVPVLAQT